MFMLVYMAVETNFIRGGETKESKRKIIHTFFSVDYNLGRIIILSNKYLATKNISSKIISPTPFSLPFNKGKTVWEIEARMSLNILHRYEEIFLLYKESLLTILRSQAPANSLICCPLMHSFRKHLWVSTMYQDLET